MQSKAKRDGRVFNLYSEPIENFDSPPDDFLVNTLICDSEAQFRAETGYQGPILERPKPAQAAPAAKPNLAAMLAMMANMNLPKEATEQLTKRAIAAQEAPESSPGVVVKSLTSDPGPSVGGVDRQALKAVNAGNQIYEKALLEYRLAVIRAGAQPVPVLRRFLLKLWPDQAEVLDRIENEELQEAKG